MLLFLRVFTPWLSVVDWQSDESNVLFQMRTFSTLGFLLESSHSLSWVGLTRWVLATSATTVHFQLIVSEGSHVTNSPVNIAHRLGNYTSVGHCIRDTGC